MSFQIFQKTLDIDLVNSLEPGVIQVLPSWRRLCWSLGLFLQTPGLCIRNQVSPGTPLTWLTVSTCKPGCHQFSKPTPSAPASAFHFVSPVSLTSTLASPSWSGLAYSLWHLDLSFPAFLHWVPSLYWTFTFFNVSWPESKVLTPVSLDGSLINACLKAGRCWQIAVQRKVIIVLFRGSFHSTKL